MTLDKAKVKAMFDNMSNQEVWLLAVLAVTIAGQRAQRLDREDIEDVCAEFVHGMHDVVETPDLVELSIQ